MHVFRAAEPTGSTSIYQSTIYWTSECDKQCDKKCDKTSICHIFSFSFLLHTPRATQWIPLERRSLQLARVHAFALWSLILLRVWLDGCTKHLLIGHSAPWNVM